MIRSIISIVIALITVGCASADWSYSIIRRSDPALSSKVEKIVSEASGVRTNILVAGYAPSYTVSENALVGGDEPESLFEEAYLSNVSDSTLEFIVSTPQSTQIKVPIRSLKRIDVLKPKPKATLNVFAPPEPISAGELLLGFIGSFVAITLIFAMGYPDFGKTVVNWLASPYVIIIAALLLGYWIYTLTHERDEEVEPERPSKYVKRSWFFRK